MANVPKVSVLTPIYNTNPAHLREMIESILNQTFSDFEFLILNDSPNNAEIEKIVMEYAKHDKRIKYSKNDKNMGITPSRNKLLKMARGEYIAIFDHDDISVPERLEKEVTFLDNNSDIGVVGSTLQLFGNQNEIWSAPEYDEDIRIWITDRCVIYHTSTMIRRSVLTKNDVEYEQAFTPCEDYRLWYRLLPLTRFYNFQEPLVKYRRFAGATSISNEQRLLRIGYGITLDIRNSYPAHWNEFKNKYQRVRYRLFGFIPLLKRQGLTWLLFDFIPLARVKK